MSLSTIDQSTGNATVISGNVNDKVGNLAALTTTDKSSAVGAINEVKSDLIGRAKVFHLNVPASKVDISGFLGHILGTTIDEQEIGSYVVHGAWDTHDYYTGLVYKLASNIAIGIIHYGTDNFSLYSASYMSGQYIRYKEVQYRS